MPGAPDETPDAGDAHAVAARLTHAALALLDLTFEPAAVCSGERFDLVMESLSDQLSEAGSALLAGRPAPVFAAPSLPDIEYAYTRRAQATLREHIGSGHLPGNARSIRGCIDGLADVRNGLRRTAPAASVSVGPFLDGVDTAFTRLLRVLEAYRGSFVRLSVLVTGPVATRSQAADAATRAERALLRCLDRCGDDRVLR